MKVSDHKQTLRDYRLTTAEIIYHLPDHPDLLQSFVWQGQIALRQGRPGETFRKVEVPPRQHVASLALVIAPRA